MIDKLLTLKMSCLHTLQQNTVLKFRAQFFFKYFAASLFSEKKNE